MHRDRQITAVRGLAGLKNQPPRRTTTFRGVWLPLTLVAMSPGCSVAPSDEATAPTAEPASASSEAAGGEGDKPAPGAAAASDAGLVQYTYSSVGKRDPFRSYLDELARTPEVAPQRRVTETEMFELDQYRLTAIITGTAQPRAMVEDPSNVGHTIRVGSRLGRHDGEVTKISSHGIVVTEETRDATGKRIRVTKRIDLPRSEFDLSGAKLQQ